MKLSEKLRLLRNEKGETQEDVSKNLGIGITTLRNYENDKLDRMPNTYQLKQLKDYYNVTYEYLLDDNCENMTSKSVSIGKELKLSEKSIKNIKNLQFDKLSIYDAKSKKLVIKEIESKIYPKAFNNFIETFENLKTFVIYYNKLQNTLILYKNITSFFYLTYITDLLEKLIKEKNTQELKQIYLHYDTLLSECNHIQVDSNINYLAYEYFIDDYNSFKNYCLSKKSIGSNYYNYRDNLTEATFDYINAIKTELCSDKYQINELFMNYLSTLSSQYEIDYDNLISTCFDKDLITFLRKNESLKNNNKNL